jgi:hypothetical protein
MQRGGFEDLIAVADSLSFFGGSALQHLSGMPASDPWLATPSSPPQPPWQAGAHVLGTADGGHCRLSSFPDLSL